MKKVMDLKYIKPSAVVQLRENGEYEQFVKKYLTEKDCTNGIYLFRTDCGEQNSVGVEFIAETSENIFDCGIIFEKTAKISKFNNGYFIISQADGSKAILVISPTSEKYPFITVKYRQSLQDALDLVYNDPSIIKEVINSIDDPELLEFYHAITQWSFYQNQKETEELFENIQNSLSKPNGTTV